MEDIGIGSISAGLAQRGEYAPGGPVCFEAEDDDVPFVPVTIVLKDKTLGTATARSKVPVVDVLVLPP